MWDELMDGRMGVTLQLGEMDDDKWCGIHYYTSMSLILMSQILLV